MSTKPKLTAGVRVSEVVMSTCDVIWTDAGANVTAKAETDTLKEGTACSELAIAAGQAVGMIGYTAVEAAAAATNINTDWASAAYNYLRFWFKSSVTLDAGDFTIGLNNAATFDTAVGAGHRNWDIPAIDVVNTWYLCQVPCPRTLTDGTELASIDAVGVTMVTDKTCTIWIDDIRLCSYDLSPGTLGMTPVSVAAILNTDLEPLKTPMLFAFPFRSRTFATNELPQAIDLTWYLGSNTDTWTSSDLEQGQIELSASERATDVEVCASSCSIVLGADLAAGETLELLVKE